ncbi:hypothetical protein RV06_GL001605 [Enterococcus haemoperoxidus]|nr:hypothetical protein RV06_GL001605 [Enterococcus haemoperoxidus]
MFFQGLRTFAEKSLMKVAAGQSVTEENISSKKLIAETFSLNQFQILTLAR